jgi:hypothetical protein
VNKVLLSIHVLFAILAVGPVAVAASMFPAAARRALTTAEADGGLTVPRALHRICRVYGVIGIGVPFFGFAIAGTLHVMGSPWLITSIVLTAIAAGVLAVLILPIQQRVLDDRDGNPTARLAMMTGLFNLLWAAVTVLMIVRPGSTTGV